MRDVGENVSKDENILKLFNDLNNKKENDSNTEILEKSTDSTTEIDELLKTDSEECKDKGQKDDGD